MKKYLVQKSNQWPLMDYDQYDKLKEARLAAKRHSVMYEGGQPVRIYKAIEAVEIMGHRSRV